MVAPDSERSAVGHAITTLLPLRVKEFRHGRQVLGYAVDGTPADCIKIGVGPLFEGAVDLVVSGINLGSNTATNVIYSGTVSAATEARILGIPSMASSLDARVEP
jgi:5'-nucleotidase